MNVLTIEIFQIQLNFMNILDSSLLYRKQLHNLKNINKEIDKHINDYVKDQDCYILKMHDETEKINNDYKQTFVIRNKYSGLDYTLGYCLTNYEI